MKEDDKLENGFDEGVGHFILAEIPPQGHAFFYCNRKDMISLQPIIGLLNCDHLAMVLFARFLHCKVIVF